MESASFINEHASALFALAGALGGGILSFVSTWLLKKRDYELSLWSKILDRRIEAHERTIGLAVDMRVMIGPGGVDDKGAVLRFPAIMLSKDAFEEWFSKFSSGGHSTSTWASRETVREVNFVQDFLVTLHQYLQGVPSSRYPEAGLLIRQDFIDLSTALEKTAYRFFERDIRRLRLGDLGEWHKYPRPETEARLRRTALLRTSEQIMALREEGSGAHAPPGE